MRETYAAVFLARFGGMLIKTSREYVKYFVITDSGSCYAGTEQRRFIASEAHNSLLCRPHEFDMHTYDKCIDRKVQTGERINVRLIASNSIKSSRDQQAGKSSGVESCIHFIFMLKWKKQDVQNLDFYFRKCGIF